MKLEKTNLEGCFVLQPKAVEDQRGHFFESFNQRQFESITGTTVNFVQDNQSFSSHGVIRGLHAQLGDYSQAKLVRVLEGEVLDVAVDVRPNSNTYGQHFTIKLSSENRLQLFIPRGFLHGFAVLSDTATFFYKCDNYYNKESECGVIYNDTDLNIDWMIPKSNQIISKKDIILPTFNSLNKL